MCPIVNIYIQLCKSMEILSSPYRAVTSAMVAGWWWPVYWKYMVLLAPHPPFPPSTLPIVLSGIIGLPNQGLLLVFNWRLWDYRSAKSKKTFDT